MPVTSSAGAHYGMRPLASGYGKVTNPNFSYAEHFVVAQSTFTFPASGKVALVASIRHDDLAHLLAAYANYGRVFVNGYVDTGYSHLNSRFSNGAPNVTRNLDYNIFISGVPGVTATAQLTAAMEYNTTVYGSFLIYG